jgi:hypothetical protein
MKPEEIGEFYDKQMKQIELTIPQNKAAKASNSDSFTDADIAAKLSGSNDTQFDAPDVDNSTENEKIANASKGRGDDWFMDFSGMLVSNVSKNEGKGASRRMID